jgi:hypothetical protein
MTGCELIDLPKPPKSGPEFKIQSHAQQRTHNGPWKPLETLESSGLPSGTGKHKNDTPTLGRSGLVWSGLVSSPLLNKQQPSGEKKVLEGEVR